MAFQKKIPCALAEGSIQCSWIWECWDAPVPVPLCMALPLLPEQGRITWSQNSQLWNLWERADIQEQQCGSAPPWRGGCSCFSCAARPGLCWVQPVPALHCSALPSASPDPTSAALGISERAVDRDNACWGPADGEKSLLLTSPRPCGSAGNLGDNWLDSFSPDGWKVLARMENNLSGVGILLAGAFWIKQSLCREVAEPQWPLQDLGAEFWLGDKCLVHVGWVLLLHPAPVLSEHTDLASWKTGTSKLHFVCLVLPGLRAVNVLCSGYGGLTALHGGLSGWILLRRRKKDGIVGEFGCQLRGGAAAAALGWEGSSLGNVCWGKGNWVLTCLEVSAPRKSPNHSWLRVHFSTRMTFSCFSLI